MIAYHDQEWGRPQHDDRILFEFLILEGAQAGLSWETILKKRQNYREAFGYFDPQIVAHYDTASEKRLLANSRNCSQSSQNKGGDHECSSIPGGAGRVRQF